MKKVVVIFSKKKNNNLIVNGTFDTDSDWIKQTGWNIGGGVAYSDGTQSASTKLIPIVPLLPEVGEMYEVKYDVVSFDSGVVIRFNFGGVSGVNRSSIGTYTQTISAVNLSQFEFVCDVDCVCSIDNVVVKKL